MSPQVYKKAMYMKFVSFINFFRKLFGKHLMTFDAVVGVCGLPCELVHQQSRGPLKFVMSNKSKIIYTCFIKSCRRIFIIVVPPGSGFADPAIQNAVCTWYSLLQRSLSYLKTFVPSNSSFLLRMNWNWTFTLPCGNSSNVAFVSFTPPAKVLLPA